MSDPHTIARHFARLVELTLHEPQAGEEQVDALRTLVDATATGRVAFETRDWQLFVNGASAMSLPGAEDLTSQLIGHSILELRIEQSATPFDLVCIARILCSAPVPGDDGRSVERLLDRLGVESVSVKAEQPAEAIRRTSVVTPSAGVATVIDSDIFKLFLTGSAQENGCEPPPVEGSGEVLTDNDPAFFEALSVDELARATPAKLFAELDNALGKRSGTAMRYVDALVKIATSAATANQYEMAADILGEFVEREDATRDRSRRRLLGVAIRRLCTPHVLGCVTALLPLQRENEDRYMRIIERAEDSGSEALVDALIAAPSVSERRTYFDALLKLNSGVRTLMFMLGDHRWFVVRNAVELLGEMRVADADAELARLLDHGDDRVRTAAAAALAKIGTSGAMKALMKGVRESTDAPPRDRVGDDLSYTLRGQSVDALTRTLEREEDSRVHMAVLTALAQLGTAEAVQRLARIASADNSLFRKTADTPLRVAAVRALGQVNHPAATAALQTLSRDKAQEVRGAAAWILMGRRNARRKLVPKPE